MLFETQLEANSKYVISTLLKLRTFTKNTAQKLYIFFQNLPLTNSTEGF